MNVSINFYASLKRYMPGGKDGAIEIDKGTTIKEVLEQFKVPMDTVKLVFLNGLHSNLDAELKDGDRLGVFPPVAGG